MKTTEPHDIYKIEGQLDQTEKDQAAEAAPGRPRTPRRQPAATRRPEQKHAVIDRKRPQDEGSKGIRAKI